MKKLITLIALLLLPLAAGYAQEDREPVYFSRKIQNPITTYLKAYGEEMVAITIHVIEVYLYILHIFQNPKKLGHGLCT